ncbi:hypothetical protein JHK82_040238 [Glycine max]|nr:hypothetical protein JHK82_040238 [Glycine max]
MSDAKDDVEWLHIQNECLSKGVPELVNNVDMQRTHDHLPSLTLTPLSPFLFVHAHHGRPAHDLNCDDMATLVEDVI